MAQIPQTLNWNAEGVQKALRRNGIHSLEELAKQPWLPKSSAYRAFRQDWSGTATMSMIIRLSYALRTPVGKLVEDPW